MKDSTKKPLVLLAKIAVLAALGIYGARQLQWQDELAAPAADSAASARLQKVPEPSRPERVLFALPTIEGERALVKPGEHLRLERDDRALSSSFVTARTARGERVVVPIALTHGDGAPFERLAGLKTALAGLDRGWLLLAIALFGPAIFLMTPRWQLLLRASGVEIPFWTLVRLNYMSHFLNTFMPGGAGGDIVKAVYVTRHAERKAEAATMVLVDRLIGVLGLLAMCATVTAFDFGRSQGVLRAIGVLSLLVVSSLALFYSETFRSVTRYESILRKLPKSELWIRIDGALYGLRAHKRALAGAFSLTILLQLLEVIGVACAGRALGLERARFAHYLAFVPLGYLANALPISFGGLGVMEGAYLALFRDAGVASASQAFVLGVLSRIAASSWGIPGAVSALFPPKAGPNEPVTSSAALA